MNIKYASLGSISTATLRVPDLLEAFADELEWQVQSNAEAWCSDEGRKERDAYLALVYEAREIDPESEDADYLVNESLMDALQDFAPPYCYFGAHEGDGADFGFWPNMNEIEQLPHIKDNSEEAIKAEQSANFSTDVVYVNDHGNVTVYGADCSVILEIV